MTAPRIGITGTTRHYQGADRAGVNAAYVRALLRAGGVPLVLPALIGGRYHPEILDGLDGLILSGGEDVDPAHFGHPRHPALGDVDPHRDALELGLFRLAWERRLPTLAICRGIQLANVALGGTLWQDLPSESPSDVTHQAKSDRDARTHIVEIAPGSRLAEALGSTCCEVNSFHHQAIKDLAPGLVATAWAPDGHIEGAESAPGQPWLLAVQWHPEEFHHHDGAPDHGLFAAFVAESRRVAVAR